jgi:hypothetical protein
MQPASRPVWPAAVFAASWLLMLVCLWASQSTNAELLRTNSSLLNTNADLIQRNQRQAAELKAAREELELNGRNPPFKVIR